MQARSTALQVAKVTFARPRSMLLSFHAGMAFHVISELSSKRLPASSLMYDARINMDLCSMLFAKQFLFSKAADQKRPWCVHVRCDSSPQFGRDYMVTQVDYVLYGTSYSDVSVSRRLMPLQCVGSRAGSAGHKIEKLVFCLGLEAEDISYMTQRVCSILTDFGTESHLWFTPSRDEISGEPRDNSDAEQALLFQNSVPLPDSDHGLHHVMLTLTKFFQWEDEFKAQLSSLARWFGLRIRCDRFIAVCINANTAIETKALKASFASLYKRTCPALVSSRWGYIYEVLNWLLPRQQSLQFLLADGDVVNARGDSFVDFSEKEVEMIRTVTDPTTSAKFWSICNLCWELAAWGAKVSSYLHSCPVVDHVWEPGRPSCKGCDWKGRLGSRLAQGVWLHEFGDALMNLPSTSAQPWLAKLDSDSQQWMFQQYHACKTAMAQRFMQTFEFWRHLPWRILAIACVRFCPSDVHETVLEQYTTASKMYAKEVLQTWQRGRAERSTDRQFSHPVTRKFLDPGFSGSLFAELEWWSCTDRGTMPEALAWELLKYSSSLTVMQILEAQHHYLNMHVSGARASLPASTCAMLRRRLNRDLKDKRFRAHLESFIGKIWKLLPFSCDSRRDFIRHVYGFSLTSLHYDTEEVAARLETAKRALQAAHAPEPPAALTDGICEQEKSIRSAHLSARVGEGRFYRVRLSTGESDVSYVAFQCVCRNPARRSYVQRVCHLGPDV